MAAICWISSESMIQSRSATDCVKIQPTFRSLRSGQQSVSQCQQWTDAQLEKLTLGSGPLTINSEVQSRAQQPAGRCEHLDTGYHVGSASC